MAAVYCFYVGLLLIMHAVYMAYSLREQLQAVHHGKGAIPAISFGGHHTSTTTMMVPVAIEVLAGMILGIAGFAHRHQMEKARLCDVVTYLRYDHQQNTGIGFIHFNHRGTVACQKDELNDKLKSGQAKKQD